MKIYSIPGKLEVTWREDVKAVVDTWSNYVVTLEEFREAVLVKGMGYARSNGGVAWIVDSSVAKGALSKEIKTFIDSDVFPVFARNGIKYFITITSQVSAITRMTVSSYSVDAGPHGMKLLEAKSVEEAVMWLKANS